MAVFFGWLIGVDPRSSAVQRFWAWFNSPLIWVTLRPPTDKERRPRIARFPLIRTYHEGTKDTKSHKEQNLLLRASSCPWCLRGESSVRFRKVLPRLEPCRKRGLPDFPPVQIRRGERVCDASKHRTAAQSQSGKSGCPLLPAPAWCSAADESRGAMAGPPSGCFGRRASHARLGPTCLRQNSRRRHGTRSIT